MYATHYHHYDPAGTSHIMDTFRKMGWVPPSEQPAYQAKWEYFKTLMWRKEEGEQNGQHPAS